MPQWEIVDLRLVVPNGCYYISLVHTLEGAALYIGRFCARPRAQTEVPPNAYAFGPIDYHWNRQRGIYSGALESVKLACEADLAQSALVQKT